MRSLTLTAKIGVRLAERALLAPGFPLLCAEQLPVWAKLLLYSHDLCGTWCSAQQLTFEHSVMWKAHLPCVRSGQHRVCIALCSARATLSNTSASPIVTCTCLFQHNSCKAVQGKVFHNVLPRSSTLCSRLCRM